MATGNILRQCCRATVTNSVFFIILLFLGAHRCSSNHTESVLFSAEGNTVHGCYHIKLPTFHGTHERENKNQSGCNAMKARRMKAINCTSQSKLNLYFINCAFSSLRRMCNNSMHHFYLSLNENSSINILLEEKGK